MPFEIKPVGTLDIQTLILDKEEWIKVNDVISWLKAHSENGFIPKGNAHALIKALIRMKNTK